MKKSKGFTLVELLAVIVILAVLVLAATPAISNIMQKSQKSSFKSEMLGIAKQMSNAYTEKSGKTIKAGTGTDGNTVTITDKPVSVWNVKAKLYNTGSSAKGYKYLCMTLAQLVDEQIISKALGNTYGGYIQMWVAEDGKQYTYINVTNSSYYFQGYTDKISASDFLPSQTSVSGDSAAPTPATSTTCPTTAVMPGENSVNQE